MDRWTEFEALEEQFAEHAQRMRVTSAGRYRERDPVGTHQVLVGTFYVFTTWEPISPQVETKARQAYAAQKASNVMFARYGVGWQG